MEPVLSGSTSFDIDMTNYQVESDSGLANSIAISLFGGNADGTDYWGSQATGIKGGSFAALLKGGVLDPQSWKTAILSDLDWLISEDVATSLDVVLTRPRRTVRRVDIKILVYFDRSKTPEIFTFSQEVR